jgi:hypothetical protein
MINIALIENEIEFNLITKKYEGQQIFWVALEPFCIPKLEKEKFSYQIIEDFFSREEFFADVSLVTERRLEEITNLVDTWVQENFPNFRDNNISILKYSIYYLTILFDGIFGRVYQLNRLFDTLKPQNVFICKRNADVNVDYNSEFPWGKDESLWTYCAELIHKEKKFSLDVIHYNIPNKANSKKENIYSLFQRKIPFTYQFLKTLKNKGISKVLRFMYSDKIVVLNLGYQWRFTENLFFERGFNVVNIDVQSDYRKKRKIEQDYIGSVTNGNNFFEFDGIDLTPLLKYKLNRIIEDGLSFYLSEYKSFLILLKKIKAKALCFSVITKPKGWIIIQAAKNLGIPIFCWGHGASGQAKYTKQHTNELLISDFYFTQGPGSHKNYLSKNKFCTKYIPIGFPSIDSLVQKNKTNQTECIYKYIYVTSGYYGNNFYLSFTPGFFDNEYFIIQRQILKFIELTNEKSLFMDYRSPYYNSVLRQYLSSNIDYENNKSFSEVIKLAEVFIIDCPTTTLLEAITTTKPIFVLTQFLGLNEVAENLLKKRAICVSLVNNLIEELEYFQKTGVYKADGFNNEYLKAFGTHLNDGFSAQRGVNEILSRISSHQKINTN